MILEKNFVKTDVLALKIYKLWISVFMNFAFYELFLVVPLKFRKTEVDCIRNASPIYYVKWR